MVFYENLLTLNNVHIRCDTNQIVGVFGANSAGKSTLMYALSGIVLVVDGRFAPVNNGPRISSACCPAQSASQQADPPVKVWA